MFSSVMVALVSLAVAVSANPGLSLKVSGPEAVDGVNNLKVVTTITNTGDETLKLLNDPRGALHTMPTDTFAITNESGETPSFIGVKVKYVPSMAAKSTGENVFAVIAPGQSVNVEHDLSAAYNFTSSGAGTYALEALNVFNYIDPETNEPVEIWADAEAHTTAVSGKLAVVRATPTLTRPVTYNGCSSSEQSALAAAASAAQSYVAESLSYLQTHTAATPRYTTWFGSYISSRHSTVLQHYTDMNSNDFSSYSFDCTCTAAGTFAYVYPNRFGTVYLCGAFWKAPTTGTDSQAGTLVHESSHFTRNGGTKDYAYGQAAAKSLATMDPDKAVMNADNHEYFSENNPAQS
uniref:Peptidyl-Lys metalloendopeptidase n=2 Tax=Grifola frondosa TaxID=5627 RepID=PLMP_GRIFR|nr:RecName: Full=Peptidyl-Lys metalloendopeptidase; Short=MEP; AltName: Full=GfMEP; Flags: Precursor [Grifola frondosa]BAB82381.1 peptidyl-Lys metalloendopeptidase [Grifola frondosa]